MADLNQTHILQQIQRYLELLYKKYGKSVYQYEDVQELISLFDEGHCSGLGGLYLYRKSEEQESLFFGNLALISEWDGKEESLQDSPFLKNVFEQTINDVRWIHNQSGKTMAYAIKQSDMMDAFEIIKPQKKSKNSPILFAKEYEIAFVFKEKELQFALKNIIKNKKMVRLGSSNHTISVMLIDGQYHIYDPNEKNYNENLKSNEVVVDSIESLSQYVKKALFGFAPKGKDLSHMPIEIQVYDKGEHQPAHYQFSPEELITKFYNENNEKNRKNNYDKLDAMAFALHRGNTRMVDFLIRAGLKIPEYFYDLKGNYYEPLIQALQYNDLTLFRILLNNKPEWVKTKGQDLISLAIKHRKYDIARYLVLEKGVKIDQHLAESIYVSQINESLSLKHKSYDVQMLQIFDFAKVKLDKLASLYSPEWMPMNAAVQKGDIESVKFLVSKGMQVTKEHYESAVLHKQNKLLQYFKQENVIKEPETVKKLENELETIGAQSKITKIKTPLIFENSSFKNKISDSSLKLSLPKKKVPKKKKTLIFNKRKKTVKNPERHPADNPLNESRDYPIK